MTLKSSECSGVGEEGPWEEGIEKIFLLTTRTADWFVQRGFIHAGAARDNPLLPTGKKLQEGRNSQLYLRTLIE